MSTIRQISHRLELSFWLVTIRLLSESEFLRKILPVIYRLFRKDNVLPVARRIWLYALSGFCVGVIFGVILYS